MATKTQTVTSEVETIDVNLAKAYLDKNVVYERGVENTNRPISLHVVNNYAVEMLNGRWQLTHQGIAFDSRGKLEDGQHRLMALVQAAEDGALDGEEVLPPQPKLTIKFMVTRGLDPETFSVLDTGMLRSKAHVLAMAGYANSRHLAATGRLLYLYLNHEYKHWRSIKVTNQQVLDTVINYDLASYAPVHSHLSQIGMIPSAASVGYFVCEQALPTANHMEFLEGLKDGVGLERDSPILVLRNYFLRSKVSDRTRRDSYAHLALYIKAWNDFALGMRRSVISWRSTEDFPVPVSALDKVPSQRAKASK